MSTRIINRLRHKRPIVCTFKWVQRNRHIKFFNKDMRDFYHYLQLGKWLPLVDIKR